MCDCLHLFSVSFQSAQCLPCLAVAVALPTNRTPAQCATRYRASLNPAIKRGAWTPEEDALLKQAVALHGTSWTKVKELVKGRTGPQCRERYCRSVAVLNAASKGRWKPEVCAVRILISCCDNLPFFVGG